MRIADLVQTGAKNRKPMEMMSITKNWLIAKVSFILTERVTLHILASDHSLYIASGLDRKADSTTDPDFSYKDVSQLSEATDDVYAESVADEDADLKDYNRLIQQTQKKLKILSK